MEWQSPEGMDEYLKSTKLCDCDNEKLKGQAKEIIKGAETPKEAALKVFYFTGNWVACESLFDEGVYKGLLRDGLFSKEQIPTIDWDGEADLVLFKSFIVKDIDTFPSWDEAMVEARKRGERSLPPTNRFYGWFPFFLANRRINDVRKP